jgi:D-lactate dehydrogenase
VQDYSLHGIQGRELHNLTVGVIGTGRIGQRVIQYLKGCDSNILAYDLYENPDVSVNAKYVSLEELLNKSDIITLHVPATEDNYHLINKKTISLMKKGVILINTARGTLIHTQDLIDAIEDKKIGGAALDVIENEANVYRNLKGEIIKHRELAILKSYPNVIITPHTAFYTDQAVSDMVENSIKSCLDFLDQK